MANALIASPDAAILQGWRNIIEDRFRVHCVSGKRELMEEARERSFDLLIVDASMIGPKISETIKSIRQAALSARLLLIGEEWGESMQVEAIIAGALGYCYKSLGDESAKKAVEAVMDGEIWVPRNAVPRLIELLIRRVREQFESPEPDAGEKPENLASLSSRELEVAKMIRTGENNKIIARKLFISERTVKAHLGSIFKKLGVRDRLHLAVFLGDIED